MRTFIAVDLPEDAKKALSEAQKVIKAAKASFTKDFHLTLKFLGEITPQKLETVKHSLAAVKFKKFTTALSGVGVFPSESYIRGVWAGLQPEEEMIQLQRLVDEALEKEFKREKGFKPHITLARIKFVADKKGFLQQLREVKVKNVTFAVGNFKLKRSTLSSKGPIYEDLAVYELQ